MEGTINVPTIVSSLSEHTHTIIFLHGRDSLGEELAEDFFLSKSADGSTLAEKFPTIRWVFPTSKLRHSARIAHDFGQTSFSESLKEFETISQWFDVWDIKSPEERTELMLDGLRESIGETLDLIQEGAKIVPLERIFLGGISQGCATGMLAFLASNMNMAGFIGMCSCLPFQNTIAKIDQSNGTAQQIHAIFNDAPINEDSTTPANTTPVFLSHSQDDHTVPVSQGRGLHETVASLGLMSHGRNMRSLDSSHERSG